MPIRKYLADPDITAEIAKAMATAFDNVCRELATRGSSASKESVAHQIAHYASSGVQDAEELAAQVLQSFRHEPTLAKTLIQHGDEPS